MIVGPQPVGGKFLDSSRTSDGQASLNELSCCSLNVGILLGLAGLDEIDADAAFRDLYQGHSPDVFRTVVASNGFWLASPFDDPVE